MRTAWAFILIILCACSSDLDIIYEHDTVPVVYAMINPYDSVHYVKVQKTFTLNHKKDWEYLNSDSIQFKEVEVFLSGTKNGQVEWTGMQLFWRDLDSLCEGYYYKGMKFRKE